MDAGQHVNKYQVTATFRGDVVKWRFVVETEDGEQHELPVRDGEEIPILLDLVRRDETVSFDPRTRLLSTGWNNPGS